ncbi:MAG: formylmethanofuran dehydrogenase subunit E family protein [bacterium]
MNWEVPALTPGNEVTICGLSLEDYIRKVEVFHGYAAPGMILGGFMVDMAVGRMPHGQLFDALCETPKCLPDAIQLLTPCTVGNGWLKILNLGRFALTLYDKKGGEGVRVFVDPSKLASWPLARDWFLKVGPKEKRDLRELVELLCQMGCKALGVQRVRIDPGFLKLRRHRQFSVCPRCGESYPCDDGPVCLGCQGQAPYKSVSPLET